mgnify:FL=1
MGNERQTSNRKSMHVDVPLDGDCCSCEAEPRWAALEDQAADDHSTAPAKQRQTGETDQRN